MPITSSAIKALRASKKKKVYNTRRKDAISEVVKKIKKLVSEKNIKDAEALIATAYKAIDKACKTNLLHKNTASRKKSRLSAMIKRAKDTK